MSQLGKRWLDFSPFFLCKYILFNFFALAPVVTLTLPQCTLHHACLYRSLCCAGLQTDIATRQGKIEKHAMLGCKTPDASLEQCTLSLYITGVLVVYITTHSRGSGLLPLADLHFLAHNSTIRALLMGRCDVGCQRRRRP